jgi:tetratricopeptide (TPR) repeat protein
VLLLLFGALAIGLWRNPKWRLTSFGLLWIAFFMLPVSNVIPMMQYMAERFLYLPLMGFLIALCGVAQNFQAYRRIAAFGAMGLVAAWSMASLNRMPVWQDEMTLYLTTIAQRPGMTRMEKNAVVAIFNLPEMSVWRRARTLTPAQGKKLLATLEAARRILPENEMLTAQVGILELRIGRIRDGIWHLELATRQNPASAERWHDLASGYRLNGQLDKAHEAIERSVKLDPNYKGARDLKVKIDHEYKPPAK